MKLKYVKYKEPVHDINNEIVMQIVREGVYPREYIMKVLKDKEMNYASAHYNLILKKIQLDQTIIKNGDFA